MRSRRGPLELQNLAYQFAQIIEIKFPQFS